jgi:hypothetical protein
VFLARDRTCILVLILVAGLIATVLARIPRGDRILIVGLSVHWRHRSRSLFCSRGLGLQRLHFVSLSCLASKFGVFESLVHGSVLIGRLTIFELPVHVSFIVLVLLHVWLWLDSCAIVVWVICGWLHDVEGMITHSRDDFVDLCLNEFSTCDRKNTSEC